MSPASARDKRPVRKTKAPSASDASSAGRFRVGSAIRSHSAPTVVGDWPRFPEVELPVLMEANAVAARVKRLPGVHDFHNPLDARLQKDLDCDVRVALLHYAPCPDTLLGERLEIYPFLGSHLLGEAVDRGGATLTLHGHAHRGTERGLTAGGHHVRNVAQPVIGHAYRLYCLPDDGAGADPECAAPASDSALVEAGSRRT